ncbi:MAG: hypothetical protein AAB558_05185 [Patescibacteria group bacterium]
MARLIHIKLTAALALSGVLQQVNNTVILSNWEQEMDGITQLASELVSLAFQLQQDSSVLGTLESKVNRLEHLLTECHLDSSGFTTLAIWERMHRVAKFEQLQGKVKEAKALIMAYRELPTEPERKRPPRPLMATPGQGQRGGFHPAPVDPFAH